MSVMRRFYISGPINSVVDGLDPEEARARFYRVQDWVRTSTPKRWWWESVNPLEVPVECFNPEDNGECGGPFNGHQYQCWMRGDLKALLDCHAMIMLPHWDLSRGAKLEYAVGWDLGLSMYHADETGKVNVP